MKLDTEAHTVTLANKDVLRYGKLLLATGANVRRLRLDGCDLDGIHYLRALGNADAIRTDTEGAEHVVLVGGSYIATEVAATLTALGRKCALVMQEDVTLERGFGKAAGGFFQKVLEDHGVEIYAGEDVERFEGEGRVATVVTKSGKRIPADAVIVGAGVTPDVMLAKRAGLEIGERGGVLTDATLATSAPDVFAAGDIAEYESVIHGGAARPDRALGRRREPGQDRRARDARPPAAARHDPVLLLRPVRLGVDGVRRPGLRLDRGDRPRLDRGRRVHHLLPRRRPPGGRADASAAPTTSSRRAS